MSQPITAVVVGAGHRALTYASYSKQRPDELKIVGVADPNPQRVQQVAKMYDIPPERCFSSAEELAAVPRFADAVINGTMDRQHVPTSVPLMQAGYHILLEKPFAISEEEMWHLVATAKETDRTVMICHVLRYAPFYSSIRKLVAEGRIGKVLNLQTIEHVSYHHMSVAFVRGKWNSKEVCGSSMLMSKCSHDLDLITWMKSGVDPTYVSSLGGLSYFRQENAPEDSGTRCLVDCPIEESCQYSARKIYLNHPNRWSFYVWQELEHLENPTMEDKIESLKTTNPHGRCVWKCDNDVVDHQSIVIEFEDGSTATHNMIGGASRPSRSIHLIGTEGEIQGVLEDSKFVIRHIDSRPGHEYSEELVDLNLTTDMHGAFGGHGGGDLRLVADFCSTLKGREPSISCTTLDDSVNGHLIGFRADQSLELRRTEKLNVKALRQSAV